MRVALLALLLILPGSQAEGPARGRRGVVVERTVRLVLRDTLNRTREVHRREVIRVCGADVSITDLTFGERLLIRSDLKRVWRADPLAGQFSELSFDEVAAHRKRAFDEIREARRRVAGTADERELDELLDAFEQFASPPKVELKATGAQREILVNGDRVRLSVQVNPEIQAPGWYEAFASLGAFHPAIAAELGRLGGVPVKGTIRYVLFLDRVVEQFEAASAREEEIPDAEFEPPKGLAKVPLRGLEPAAERSPAKPAQLRRDFREDEIDRQNNPLRDPEKDKRDKP